jgi:ABC-type molybdate transport system substrate-binding protein
MPRLSQAALLAVALSVAVPRGAEALGIEPPWNAPPENGKNFTVPGIDNVPDLYGDVTDPQLVVLFAGNQYMVVPDLLAAFRQVHPQYERIFVETLPPGVLADQLEQGALIVGNMRIALKADVYTAGRGRMQQMQRSGRRFSQLADYARNRLAIMTYLGNPYGIAGWPDLARAGLSVCMPNPKWEGIAANAIVPALRAAGGEALVRRIYEEKGGEGSTLLTQIHHRQTPLRIMEGKCVAGAVWYTEAYYHASIANHPVSFVTLPVDQDHYATYTAGVLEDAPHRQAGREFVDFLRSPEGQAVYRRYGFLPPE